MNGRIRNQHHRTSAGSGRSRGGVATVMQLLVENPDNRFAIRAIPTFEDSGAFVRLWLGITGMVTAVWLFLRPVAPT